MTGWLIGGPTGSGKSALALKLAAAEGGEIVNADSMQVYADLRVLTARPTARDEAAAPHHLYGVADAAEAWSAGRWLRAAQAVIVGIEARGAVPIVVGGTGLYFRALLGGLADIPPVPPEARTESQALFDALGEAAFRARLGEVDRAAEARIAPGDRQRLTRAFEVFAATGRPLTAWREASPPAGGRAWRRLVIEPDREALYARLDARFEAMLAAGALEEVRALAVRGLAPDRPAMKALGVRPLIAQLKNELTLADAAETAKRDTRRYAKRQLTWFRHQAADWERRS